MPPADRSRKKNPLTPLAHGALNHCFGCGLENPTGLRLKFFVDADKNVVCHLRLARRFAGPPGHAHGGIIATLLDEAMSKSNRARGILAMTRHLEIQYLRPVPLGQPLTLTARHLDIAWPRQPYRSASHRCLRPGPRHRQSCLRHRQRRTILTKVDPIAEPNPWPLCPVP